MENLTLNKAIRYIKEVVQKNRKNKENNTIVIPNSFINSNDCADKYEQVAKWLKELKSYKDTEKQGLLIKLPCKVGDDVYIIPSQANYNLNIINCHAENNRVYHQYVNSITFNGDHWYIESCEDIEFGTGRVLLDIFYGKTWFLTLKEATEKLKELENK